MRSTIIPCILLLLASFAQGQGKWDLKIDREGIQVYHRKAATGNFNEIKLTTSFEGKLSDILFVLLDFKSHPQWSYKTKAAHLIKRNSVSDVIFYKEIESPPTISNRDLTAQLTFMQDPKTKVLTIHIDAVSGYVPVKEGIVRVTNSSETWSVVPTGDHVFTVEYILRADPGGNIPAFAMNMFAIKGPFESFKGLKAMVAARKDSPSEFKHIEDGTD